MPGIFPTLPGLSWSTFKAPQFATITQKAVSGRELRITLQPHPTWLFTLKYDYLRPADLQELMGFYLLQQGSSGEFLFIDPTDREVANGYITVGDGVSTEFTIGRLMGAFYEPVQYLTDITTVYFDGAPYGTRYGEWDVGNLPARLFFSSPPPAGVLVTAAFAFGFLCKFPDDTYSFENFMYQLWSLKEIKLQSLLA